MLVAAVLVHWIAPDWRAFLITAVVMIVLSYIIAAVIPRSIGRQRAGRVATSAAAVLRARRPGARPAARGCCSAPAAR